MKCEKKESTDSTRITYKKQRKPKTKRLYFGPDVDVSIVKYNGTDDSLERSLIYQREIRSAFEKLAENIIHTFKFYYTDGQSLQQLQHEVVSFLVEKLPKFKQSLIAIALPPEHVIRRTAIAIFI